MAQFVMALLRIVYRLSIDDIAMRSIQAVTRSSSRLSCTGVGAGPELTDSNHRKNDALEHELYRSSHSVTMRVPYGMRGTLSMIALHPPPLPDSRFGIRPISSGNIRRDSLPLLFGHLSVGLPQTADVVCARVSRHADEAAILAWQCTQEACSK